jgi:hypothetical protein
MKTKVTVDSRFLDYMMKEVLTLNLHQLHGYHHSLIGTAEVALHDVLESFENTAGADHITSLECLLWVADALNVCYTVPRW